LPGPGIITIHSPASLVFARIQHRASAEDRAASTREECPTIKGSIPINIEHVIVRKFDSRLDILDRLDADPVAFHLGFTVGIAGMIDETCIVAADRGVDVFVIADAKQEGVRVVGRVLVVARFDGFGGEAFADVVDYVLPSPDGSQGENPKSVYPRRMDLKETI
jgi:hypothetical protein